VHHNPSIYGMPPLIEMFHMAFSLKDAEMDALARQVASLTGESLTQTIRTALAERLKRERLKRGPPADLLGEVKAIFAETDRTRDRNDRSADEIIGYDEHGAPN
jgi:antitoxin VapB